MNRYLILVVSVALLSACGGRSKKVEEVPPSPLPSIASPVLVEVLWSTRAGSGYDSPYIELRPQIIPSTGQLAVASPGDGIRALDIDSGDTIWKSSTDGRLLAGAGAGDGLAIVVDDDGKASAFDVNDGSLSWTSQVGGEVLATPVAEDGTVVLRTVDDRLFGLSSATGEELWQYREDSPGLSLRGSSAPIIEGGVVITGFANGRIVANDISAGRNLWESVVQDARGRNEIQRLTDVDAQPVLLGSVLYAAAFQGKVMGFALGSRRVLWAREISTFQNISVDDDHVYVSDTDDVIHALNRYSGETVWDQSNLKRRKLSAPVAVGQFVVVADEQGYLHVMQKHDGSFVGQHKLGSPLLDQPLVANNRIITLSRDGRVTALEVLP